MRSGLLRADGRRRLIFRRVRRRRSLALELSLDSVRAVGRRTFGPGLRGICQGARVRSSGEQYSIERAGFGLRQDRSLVTGRWSLVVSKTLLLGRSVRRLWEVGFEGVGQALVAGD